MPAEKGAVDITLGYRREIARSHEGVRIVAEHGKELVGIAEYHRPLAPGDAGNEQGGYLDVALVGKAAGKLHGIIGHKLRHIILLNAGVEKRFEIVFHFV